MDFNWRYGHGPDGLEEAQVHEQTVGAGIALAGGCGSMEGRRSNRVGAQKGGCGHLAGQGKPLGRWRLTGQGVVVAPRTDGDGRGCAANAAAAH